jgi:ubiquinone/menaquinone biosynthesis C-methylase UbiE
MLGRFKIQTPARSYCDPGVVGGMSGNEQKAENETMGEFNLLGSVPRCPRDVRARRESKEENQRLALQFGREYFDGTREQGYGGYQYDGRWVAVAKRAIEHWKLQPGDRVLDVGCAKGFFVKDLRETLPGLEAIGIDISDYALKNAHPDAEPHLSKASCDNLPFDANSFAAVFAINTIHNLEREGCRRALQEIERVCPGRGFVQVDAYRTEAERALFLDWMLTARTFDTPAGWLRLFHAAAYNGEHWWTILEADDRASQPA